MRALKPWMLSFALVFAAPVLTLACIWDRDTKRQEAARFPSVLELITGKFLRHSPEFYKWRIQDRLAKIKAAPENVDLLDDLAVASEKTGAHQNAIDVLLLKEQIRPGLYETYSNLGTVHILAGDFELGLPLIDKALAINPNAHFGREIYQKWLVEYAMARMKENAAADPNAPKFPLHPKSMLETKSPNFAGYVALRLAGIKIETPVQKTELMLNPREAEKAVTGVLGMMRFANHENPLLLEVLGDLLMFDGTGTKDSRALAARAYLMASKQMKDDAARDAYRILAKISLIRPEAPGARPQPEITTSMAKLEEAFDAELEEAQKWYAELKEKELAWIKQGVDVEAEYDKLYTVVVPKKQARRSLP